MTRLLAVDFGSQRIGLAVSEGQVVIPIESIANHSGSVSQILAICQERLISRVLIGLPLSLSGARTKSTDLAISFGEELAAATQLEVRFIDERLTTVSATSKLRESGKDSRGAKKLVDSQSAAEILESALNQIRLGRNPGIGLEEID
ncbi:MAG: Holliday junction resolvase RuvX [Actinomycetota bacterium]